MVLSEAQDTLNQGFTRDKEKVLPTNSNLSTLQEDSYASFLSPLKCLFLSEGFRLHPWLGQSLDCMLSSDP